MTEPITMKAGNEQLDAERAALWAEIVRNMARQERERKAMVAALDKLIAARTADLNKSKKHSLDG